MPVHFRTTILYRRSQYFVSVAPAMNFFFRVRPGIESQALTTILRRLWRRDHSNMSECSMNLMHVHYKSFFCQLIAVLCNDQLWCCANRPRPPGELWSRERIALPHVVGRKNGVGARSEPPVMIVVILRGEAVQ